jgi:leucyl aminopeptidase
VSILIDEEHAALAAEAAARGQLIVRAVGTARDLVDTPAADCTPSLLAEMAVELCGASGVSVEVFDASRIAEERLGGLLGVARGSTEPPRLLMLRYDPRSTGREGAGTGEIPTVVLVGKGITFDSGGLSLKATEGMLTMKTDMAGAAAVIAALSACRDVGIEASVVGITPLTENMPGGSATKLGDVLRMRDGTTVEVVNTDAEGRLVLGDGLALAREQSPAAVIDLATLTGACVTALGRKIAGLMGNDEPLLASLTEASARCGEPVWRLPLPTQYRVDLDSEIAELKNMGAPRGGAGAIYAGLFLQHFVGTTPWAHLDIAGPARSDEDVDEFQKGATGFGVRLLLEWLSSLAIDRPGAPAGRP